MENYSSPYLFDLKRKQIFKSLRQHLRRVKLKSPSTHYALSPVHHRALQGGRTDSTTDIDTYWPVQRRPHPVTTRLPSSGTVQDLVDWFDQGDDGRKDTKSFTGRGCTGRDGSTCQKTSHTSAMQGMCAFCCTNPGREHIYI